MLQDDEFEELVITPERVAALGFKPQSEVLVNHLLPYASELDDESTGFLEQVKNNLAKAVMLREMKPGCGVWTSRLMKYIRMYGLKFSKEDHIAFIKLAYELVMIPDLEPCKIHKFATLFLMLTKKRHLLSPDELTLPWRPLYELGKKVFNKSATNIGMYHYLSDEKVKGSIDILAMIRKYLSGNGLDDALTMFGFYEKDENELPNSLEGSFLSMVKCARPYFDPHCTQEMLDEMLPQILPWSSEVYMIGHLAIFLPVALHPKYAAVGHQLWFDELMTLWDTCYNAQCGITDLMMLFSGLAKRNPGVIDWTPHVPKMFSRFLHSLHLPVSYKEMQISKAHCLDTKQIASWIVWTINPDGVVLKQLRSFLAGIESYLHSANSGRWSYRLRDLLRKLAREFINRVRRERKKKFKESWENKTPEQYKLREEDITEFVNIVLEPTLQAVYSRSGSLDISIALQNLATIRPAIVIPPLLERLRNALSSLTEPHRMTAGMTAVASVARPMLRGPVTGYPEGPTHVIPLLMAILPGLDPNDIKKTLVSLHFILIFVWMTPIIDCSSAHEHWNDLTEEELLTCESTAQFEDFVLVFLDRLFVIVESSALENVRLDTKDLECFKSKTDAIMETAISSAAIAVLMQCSPKIFKEALRKFKSFATESTFETNVSGSMVGVLLRVFARADTEATLAAFMPQLCEELLEHLTDEALIEENPSRDILYRLVLLRYVVECDGAVLLKYIPDILPVLDRALKVKEKTAQARACEVLRNILQYFSFIEVIEWRSSPKDYSTAPKEWLPIREWGHGCPLKNANLKWHVPNDEEAKCVQMLIDRYLKPAVEELRAWVKGDLSLTHEEMIRTLNVVNASVACGLFFPHPKEEAVKLVESAVPATSIPYSNGVKHEVTLAGRNMRVALTELLVGVQANMLAHKSDDTKCFEILIHIWEHVLIVKFGRGSMSVESRLRSFGALERALEGRGANAGVGGGPIRLLAADAARLHSDARADLTCEAGITGTALTALHCLIDLSINTYTSVRVQAQSRLYWMLSHYPYSYRVLIPKLCAVLNQSSPNTDESLTTNDENSKQSSSSVEEIHARHKGVLCMLAGPRQAPLVAKQDWEAARTLWPCILNAPLSEKPSIHKLEQVLGETLHRHFPTVNTRLTMSQSAVDAAKVLLTDDQINDESFASLLSNAVQKEKEHSDKTEKMYLELMEELVVIAEKPNVQWRRLELTMQMLTFCPSLQTNYPINAVRLGVNLILHDDIVVRKTALKLTHYVLRQSKRKVKKIYVDPYDMAGMKRPEKHVPGYREDLDWAMWSEENTPISDEEWERPILRNSLYGFYAWPKTLQMIAPPSEQVTAAQVPPEELTEVEKIVYDFFDNDANVEKLVKFMTVEDKKGKDKFNGLRFCVFKLLFCEFGERIFEKLLPAAVSGARGSAEAAQRFAAEIAAAALRAPAYWPQARARAMHEHAMEIISAGLSSVTPETLEDWGTSLATGMEKMCPRRGAALLQRLLALCVPPPARHTADLDHNTSFVICARLYALQGALGSLKWRTAKLSKLVLQKLEAANFVQHPYQIVRESVGSLLMTIFDVDLVFPGGWRRGAPSLSEFVETVMPRLAALYDENGDIVIKPSPVVSAAGGERPLAGSLLAPRAVPRHIELDAARLQPAILAANDTQPRTEAPAAECDMDSCGAGGAGGAGGAEGAEGAGEAGEAGEAGGAGGAGGALAARLAAALRLAGDAPHAAHEHARAANLLTTVLRACMGVIVRGVSGWGGGWAGAVGVAMSASGRGAADELPRAAAALLAARALAHHAPEQFDDAVTHLHQRAQERSWWARLACLELAQPLLFYGLPYLCAEPERAVTAEALALKLMQDPRLEVRQSAAKLLTGLMHCRALPNEDKTLRALSKSCKSKDLVERHFGVLGLCSYLASRPYGLGPKIGNVLAELARHTNAPDPIPATIRTTLAEFRRTHQDDWPKHRQQLTEEELDLLADLSSPPSYCA